MNSSEQLPSASEPAADLFALLSSPFERDLDVLGYTARLQLLPPAHHPLFAGGTRSGYFSMLTGREACPGKEWTVDIAYVPAEGTLGFTRLELPLRAPAGAEALVLQRTAQDYFIPLLRQGCREQPLQSPLAAERTLYGVPPSVPQRLLAEAGYTLPQLFTTPNDLRLHMAELTDRATAWTVSEAAELPLSPSWQITTTRILGSTLSGQHREADLELTTVYETITPDKKRRHQAVITYTGTEYSVAPPRVVVRHLYLTDQVPGLAGSEVYALQDERELQPTMELLGRLIDGFVDGYSGAAA